MSIRERVKGETAVLRVKGDLMGGALTSGVRERVKTLLSEGITNLVLDLGGVRWMNSNGMGMLMACYSSAQQSGGRIVLCRVSSKVKQLMGITKIDRLFDHFNSVRLAKKSFG
jgi:anti-sigma B factor antagonist